MSIEAIGWVLRDAPGVPAQCLGVLIGLAEHADKHGRGAYPSAATLAAYARKSERQVRYDLSLLTDGMLIRPGDQLLAKDLPVNRRPVVYDLAMERTALAPGVRSASPPGVQSTAPQAGTGMQPIAPQGGMQSTAPQEPSDLRESSEVQPTAPPEDFSGVQPTSYKPPTTEVKKTSSKSKEPAKSPDALFDAPPAETKRGRRLKAGTDPRFDTWYAAYPKHVDRGDAEKEWATVMAAGIDPAMLTEAAASYRTDQRVLSGYIKSPARWLRGKCWMDEPEPSKPPPTNGARPTNFTDEEYSRGWK